MVKFLGIAAGLGFLAAAIVGAASAGAAPATHHVLETSYHGHSRDFDDGARTDRSRELSPLQFGQVLTGPPLTQTQPLVRLPGMGPPPYRCEIGQTYVNGSCW